MNKRKGWELAGYIAGAVVLLVPLLLAAAAAVFFVVGICRPSAKYEVQGLDSSSWVCTEDSFEISILGANKGPAEVQLTRADGTTVSLTHIGTYPQALVRDCHFYDGTGAWYWDGEGGGPWEESPCCLYFTPYYLIRGNYALCLNVESIYPEIAEEPFLIFKRID